MLRKLCEYKGGRDYRSRSVQGPYPYAREYTAKIQCSTDYGVFKGEEQPYDLKQNMPI